VCMCVCVCECVCACACACVCVCVCEPYPNPNPNPTNPIFIRIYGVYTVLLAEKSPYIHTVIYGVQIRFWPTLEIYAVVALIPWHQPSSPEERHSHAMAIPITNQQSTLQLTQVVLFRAEREVDNDMKIIIMAMQRYLAWPTHFYTGKVLS